MFTGLIREIGRLCETTPRGGITALELDAPVCAPLVAVGDSLAVNGVCLTVTRLAGARLWVEATAETRRVSTLGSWRRGELLHLEPALRVGEALGGHFVLGHVDGVGRVVRAVRRQGALWLTVALPEAMAVSLLPKGSIAVDGVSLTLDEGPFTGRFTATVIPHTLAATTLGTAVIGRRVNLELDVLAKAARGVAVGATAAVAGAATHERGGRLSLGTVLARGFGGRIGRR